MRQRTILLFIVISLLFGGLIFDQDIFAKSTDKKKIQVKTSKTRKKIYIAKPLILKLQTTVKPGNMLGAIGDTLPLKASLKIKANGKPVSNQTLKFYVDNKFINNADTDGNGRAKVMYKVPKYIGSKTILVKFLGKNTFLKSSGTANFGSIKSSTKFSLDFLNPHLKAKAGGNINIKGTLIRITDKKGLDGREVEIFVNGTQVKKIATGSNGYYSSGYKIPSGLTGNIVVKVRFSGDKYYLGSSKSISRKIYAPMKIGYLRWGSTSGKVGQYVSVKASFNKKPIFGHNTGIGGKKIRVWCRIGNNDNLTLGSAYTNSKGIAYVKFTINQPAITTYLYAHVDNVVGEYKLIKLSKNIRYKVYRSPVKIYISGPNSGRIGDTLFFNVIVRNITNNEGVRNVKVIFANKMSKKTSGLGSAGFFYKIPYYGGLGNRTITVKSEKTGKYFAGIGTKVINIKPKNN